MGNSVQISEQETAVLTACDGKRTSREIAQIVIDEPRNDIQNEADVYALLQKLHDDQRIVWTLEISTRDAFPEREMRQLIKKLGDKATRERGLQALNELEAARNAVAAAAGNVEQLDRALDELNSVFSRLTGNQATRRGGQVYAARTLIYEDCRRDVTVEIGRDLIRDLEAPFKLLLTSVRWYTFNAAKMYRVALRKAFREALAQFPGDGGGRTVDFSTFWLWVQPLFFGDGPLPTNSLETLFHKKWDAILSLPEGQRRVSYSSAELQARVQAQFRAPHPGHMFRHHTPDVMLAASSAEAVQRGQYTFVLGEFHIGLNALAASCFVNQHPHSEQFLGNFAADMPEPRVIPLAADGKKGQTSRTQFIVSSSHDVQIVFSHDQFPQPQLASLSTGELVVEEMGRDLIVRTRDGRYQFDIINIFAQYISAVILDHFKIGGQRDYTPRIAIDKMVVRRESWRFPADSIPFAFETNAAKQFLGARQWMRHHGMPRFIFVKVPVESKPVYIDFESPIYVRVLAKLIRRTVKSDWDSPKIAISEMYPAHDELWLVDAAGQRYTSELRLVVLDTSA
jgi:hypothetical protein